MDMVERSKKKNLPRRRKKNLYIKYDSGFIYFSDIYKQNRNKNLHKYAMKCCVYFGWEI